MPRKRVSPFMAYLVVRTADAFLVNRSRELAEQIARALGPDYEVMPLGQDAPPDAGDHAGRLAA